VPQELALFFQRDAACGRSCCVELGSLEPQEIEALETLRLARVVVGQPLRELEPAGSPLAVAREDGAVLSVGVEQAPLLDAIEQALVIVLTMDLDQERRQLAEQAARDRTMIHVGAGATVARERAGEDELDLPVLLTAFFESLGELLREPARDLGSVAVSREDEATLDARLARPGPHEPRARALAEQELQGVDEQALPRPGLARHDVQAGSADEARALDQREVANGELREHRPRRSHARACSCNAPAASASSPIPARPLHQGSRLPKTALPV
jgi:hypothetical protein